MTPATTAPRVPMVDNRFSSVAYQAEDTDDDDDAYLYQQQQQNNHSTSSGRRSVRKSSRSTVLDDDDFSVAPSMDQDVKSVVSVGFDDVYKRGRKVRLLERNERTRIHISHARLLLLQIVVFHLTPSTIFSIQSILAFLYP